MDDWTPEMDEAMKNISAKANKEQVGGIHYVAMKIQPWEVMESVLTRDEFIGFLKGNVIKYSMRQGRKPDALDDAEKAHHYRMKLKEMLDQ